MKGLTIAAAILGSFAASSQAADAALEGIWVLTPQAQAGFMAACNGMTMEFRKDDRITRKTGQLVYTTVVVATADGDGWLLKEELESQNGKPGCGGKSADEIVLHLQHSAYVELDESVLRYYRVKGAKRVIEFERVDTLSAVPRDTQQ